MLEGWLTLFIVVTLVSILISAYLMEENPIISIPFIMIGLIFSVICAYGVWDVEWVVLHSDNTLVLESVDYGIPYTFVFVFLFFVFVLFFFRAGFNLYKEAIETKGEFTYSTNKNYFR